ncbi:MAG: DNA repair protein RecO [Clostridia bacterium]|nr:DNA repair protein RecO [Clostridia bacterium]
MEEKESGIVLSAVNFSENDKILNVFTLGKGVVCARIKGVKKAGAKLKFAAEPFCFAEYIFSKNADKRTVIGATLIDSFYPIRENIHKYFCAGAVVEFIKHFYKEELIDEQEFFICINALKEIAYTENHLTALVKFLILALENFGYKITLDGCFNCEKQIDGRIFFDYRNGAFLCEDCFNGEGREVSIFTYRAMRSAIDNALTDSDEGAKKALKLLDYYITNRAEENLNSLKELIKIF